MALTILEGSTFCISDERGDIHERTGGFFARDTRFLSVFRLTVNGQPPLLLSSGKVDYFSAVFYLRNPPVGLAQDSVAIARERFVSEALQERIVVENVTSEPISFDLAVHVASDFADIFAVKEYDFALGDPLRARPLPTAAPLRFDADKARFVIDDPEDGAFTQVAFSKPGAVEEGKISYRVALEPRSSWELTTDVVPSGGRRRKVAQRVSPRRFGEQRARVHDTLTAWQLHVPQLEATWHPLLHTFNRSVSDLASLRMRGGNSGLARLPAAGMPWFMTVFGRDTLITSLQTLIFGPELAIGALEVLAELQALEDDPETDAEPGKIVHEVRHGKAAKVWFHRYYGTVDATPLYLVLLSEVWRWTGDAALAEQLREPALRALAWIDEHGDSDGDGFVEYRRRTDRGLENQSWKDSGDSQRFADGRLALPPIAPCEVQGYVYDAKRRLAELAREAWRDDVLGDRLDEEAGLLRERFDQAFWVEERGGYYALALDGAKERVDSLCSNIGHLLWSGIVPEERAEQVISSLTSGPLWSGWGVRTMSTEDAGYSPLSYHNGTVWPHDNSLIAAGLARYGRRDDALRIVRHMLEAAAFFGYELPEVFAGLERGTTPFPIAYPTAARPQAWAAGTPVLLLQVLLGLEPDRASTSLVTTADADVPDWAGSLLLTGVPAFGRVWDVHLEDGHVRVESG